MPLHPFLAAHIEVRRTAPRFGSMSAEEARASKAGARFEVWPGAGPVAARDLEVPMPWGACRARIYRPQVATRTLPLVVLFHGGGFVIWSVETHDGMARSIAGGAGCSVLSVDYRLAPEHPYPAPLDDAEAAIRWAQAEAESLEIDPAHIVLAGDSAGGSLALGAALRLADAMPLAGLALVHPMTDAPDSSRISYKECAQGYGLTDSDMQWFWSQYGAPTAVEARPLHSDRLDRLPATFIATAAYDVLRDEGEALAAKLIANGVRTTARRVPGVNHNFLAFARSLPAAQDTYADLVAWMFTLFGRGCS